MKAGKSRVTALLKATITGNFEVASMLLEFAARLAEDFQAQIETWKHQNPSPATTGFGGAARARGGAG